jgi:hypothetical protein
MKRLSILFLLACVFMLALFSSCKQNLESVGKPNVFSFKVVDTTYDENDSTNAILAVEYTSDAIIGIKPNGFEGYLPSTGECQFEVEIGVRTPLIISACNSKSDPELITWDTLWVLIPVRITKPPVDNDTIPDDTNNILGFWTSVSMTFVDTSGNDEWAPIVFNSVTFYNNGTFGAEHVYGGMEYGEWRYNESRDTLIWESTHCGIVLNNQNQTMILSSKSISNDGTFFWCLKKS